MVLVAAVDRSDRASTVIREAKSLADAFNDTVHVVHVLNPTTTEITNVAEKRDASFKFQNKAKDTVNNLVDSVSDQDFSYEPVGLMGDPADEVVSYAEEQDARYIIVAGRKRSPTGKAIFGSISQSILLEAKCPVVSTIKQSN